MKKQILEQLSEMEKQYDIKILYACESGSREWGFSSDNSDYDIRFIYMHKKVCYLSLDKKKDVIDKTELNNLEFHGWELVKTLKLLRNSNSSVYEWLQSNTIYKKEDVFYHNINKVKEDAFNPRSIFLHHYHLAKKNNTLIQKNKSKQNKLYLYTLRSIFACKWIVKYHTMPTNKFDTLLENFVQDEIRKNEINDVLTKKRSGMDSITDSNILILDEYIRCELEMLESINLDKPTTLLNERELTLSLDHLFRETINEWEE